MTLFSPQEVEYSTKLLICLNGSLSPTETVQMQWSPLAACRDRPGKSHGNRSYHSHPTPAVRLKSLQQQSTRFSEQFTELVSTHMKHTHCHTAAVNPLRVLPSDKSSQAGWTQSQTLDLDQDKKRIRLIPHTTKPKCKPAYTF